MNIILLFNVLSLTSVLLLSFPQKAFFGTRFYSGLILVTLLELKRFAHCNYLNITGYRQL
jgi:hypothetical protein